MPLSKKQWQLLHCSLWVQKNCGNIELADNQVENVDNDSSEDDEEDSDVEDSHSGDEDEDERPEGFPDICPPDICSLWGASPQDPP